MNQFDTLDVLSEDTIADGAVNPIMAAPAKTGKNTADIALVKQAFETAVENDPDFLKKVKALSDCIEVTNSLGWKDSGNIVPRRDESGKIMYKVDANGNQEFKETVDANGQIKKTPLRYLDPTAKIVGYRFKNVGKTTIQVPTELFAKDASGKFVSNGQTAITLKPGASIDLSRKYATLFASMPEFSMTFKNGVFIKGSSTIKLSDAATDQERKDDLLNSYFFKSNDTTAYVNSDEIKIPVADKVVDSKNVTSWVIKPEFLPAFGFLNNVTEPTQAAPRAAKAKVDGNIAIAAYLRQISEAGKSV